jgi:hypothetical protein
MRRALLLVLVAPACGGEPDLAVPCDQAIAGNICTIVGDGTSGYAGDDGPALAARLSLPQDTLRAPDGTLYIVDWNNHRIRKLVADGTIRAVAGRGELSAGADDPASSDLNHPTGLLLDPGGNRLIVSAWHNSQVRTVDLGSGTVNGYCGDGRRAYFGDDGPAAKASLDLPASLAFDPAGNLVIMDQANQVIRSVDAAGNIRRLAGRCLIDAPAPAGPGACPPGEEPLACLAPSGKSTCGSARTCGAACTPSYGGDDGPALELRMSQPFGQSADPAGRLAFDPAGDLVFADTGNALLRKIDRAGVVRRVAGRPPVNGIPQVGYEGDGGPALEAKLSGPVDLAFDADGTLYFTDVGNHCVRAIAPDGTIRRVVGRCGQAGYSGDRGPALEARLRRPYGLEIAGDLLTIADTGNNVIRQVRLR